MVVVLPSFLNHKNNMFYLKMFLVGTIHSILSIALYHERVSKTLSPILDSDFVLFSLSSILAFGLTFT
jgi:hypothetical protein